MKKAVIGCLEETIDTLDYLYHIGETVDIIYTINSEKARNLKVTNYVDLKDYAKKNKISIEYFEKYSMKTKYDIDLILDCDADFIFVLGWQRLIPGDIIEKATQKFFGFHGSYNFLPWGRGRSPLNWSIIEKRNRFILHMFEITPSVDDGNIVDMEVFEINQYDNIRSLYYKTAIKQAIMIKRFINNYDIKKNTYYPQIGDNFYYPKRNPEDGLIFWNNKASDICCLVRALTKPYPGAFSYCNNKKIHIWSCQYFWDDINKVYFEIGEVIFTSSNEKKEFVVNCGEGQLLVTEYTYNGTIKKGYVLS